MEHAVRGQHLQRDKVFNDGLVVTVDELRDGFDHAVPDVVIDVCHEPEVQDRQPPIRSTDEVARMGIYKTISVSIQC